MLLLNLFQFNNGNAVKNLKRTWIIKLVKGHYILLNKSKSSITGMGGGLLIEGISTGMTVKTHEKRKLKAVSLVG